MVSVLPLAHIARMFPDIADKLLVLDKSLF